MANLRQISSFSSKSPLSKGPLLSVLPSSLNFHQPWGNLYQIRHFRYNRHFPWGYFPLSLNFRETFGKFCKIHHFRQTARFSRVSFAISWNFRQGAFSSKSLLLCAPISISFKTFANFPRFRNLNSTVPIDAVRVKSYVDSLHRSGQLRDQFLPLTMTTVLWIETHQSWARFVIHQSLTTTVVQIVRLSKSTLSTIKLYPLYTLSTMINIFHDMITFYLDLIHFHWFNSFTFSWDIFAMIVTVFRSQVVSD